MMQWGSGVQQRSVPGKSPVGLYVPDCHYVQWLPSLASLPSLPSLRSVLIDLKDFRNQSVNGSVLIFNSSKVLIGTFTSPLSINLIQDNYTVLVSKLDATFTETVQTTFTLDENVSVVVNLYPYRIRTDIITEGGVEVMLGSQNAYTAGATILDTNVTFYYSTSDIRVWLRPRVFTYDSFLVPLNEVEGENRVRDKSCHRTAITEASDPLDAYAQSYTTLATPLFWGNVTISISLAAASNVPSPVRFMGCTRSGTFVATGTFGNGVKKSINFELGSGVPQVWEIVE